MKVISFFCILFLVSCGGGGSSPSNFNNPIIDNTNTNTSYVYIPPSGKSKDNCVAQTSTSDFVENFNNEQLDLSVWSYDEGCNNNGGGCNGNNEYQNYTENCNEWIEKLSNYNFDKLFENVNSKIFDDEIDKLLYPTLLSINSMKEFGKLKSKFLNIVNKELIINPDWDEDSIMDWFYDNANIVNEALEYGELVEEDTTHHTDAGYDWHTVSGTDLHNIIEAIENEQ